MTERTLYERLGGAPGIAKIADDIWINHNSNPLIKTRYARSNAENVKRLVREMVGAGTGGSEVYSGKNMLDAHRGMNISDQEFNAVVDDVLNALAKNSVGQREKEEMLSILWSMKGEIVHV
jgi:hemoglobin